VSDEQRNRHKLCLCVRYVEQEMRFESTERKERNVYACMHALA
jgi:hypothetical protein